VPTIDTERYSWLLSEIIGLDKPVIFVGESGTAKTVTIANQLMALDQDTFILLNMNFSSRTRSIDVQRNLDDRLEKRSGKNFGPPVGKKLLIFIDDLQMPTVDVCGTQ
jgi:dynein heavy chain